VTALLVATGIGLLVLPGVLAPRWDHLSPREWTRLNVASLVIGLWAVRVGLLLSAAPTILRAVGVEHAAVACHELFGPVLPGGAPVGLASVISLAFIQHHLRRSKRRTREALELVRVEAWLGDRSTIDGVDLVRLPTSEPLAYAVGGSPPQVVISEGLVDVLSQAELDAVVRHERSHLVHNHQRHLSLAAAAEAAVGWFQPVRTSIDALRLGVERWADEDAASVPPERPLVRAALVKVTATMLGPVPSFTTGCTILDRLAALDREPPDPTTATRAAAAAPLLGLTALAGVTFIAWSTFTHHGLLGLVGFCPM
jgi:hypothetical protein